MRATGTVEEPMRGAQEWALPEYDRRTLPDRRRGQRRAVQRTAVVPSGLESLQFKRLRGGRRRLPTCGFCRFAHPHDLENAGVRLCLLTPSSGRLVFECRTPCEGFEPWMPLAAEQSRSGPQCLGA